MSLAPQWSPSPTWVDITKWVLKIDTSFGRQHELQQMEPATIDLVLDDKLSLFSPWNQQSPWNNRLLAKDAYLDNFGQFAWNVTSAGGTCYLAGANAQGAPFDDAWFALAISTETATGGNVTVVSGLVAASPDTVFNGFADFMWAGANGGNGTARSCTVGIEFFDSSKNSLGVTTGTAANDSSLVTCTVQATSPSNAAYKALVLTVESMSSVASNGQAETHLVQRAGITQRYVDPDFGTVDNYQWGPGSPNGLTNDWIGNPIQVKGSGTGLSTYDAAYAYVRSAVPQIVNENTKDLNVHCADALNVINNIELDFTMYAGYLLSLNPVLYWKMDESIGSVGVSDHAQNGNAGLVTAPVYPNQAGLLTGGGQDASFGIVAPGVVATNKNQPALFSSASACSFCFWMKAEANGAIDVQLASPLTSSTDSIFQLTTNSSGTLGLTWIYGASNFAASGSSNVLDGHSHFVCVTYDLGTGVVVMYVDGTSEAQMTHAGAPGVDPNSQLTVSGASASMVQFSHVALFHFALSSSEQGTLWALGSNVDAGWMGGTADQMIEWMLLGADIPASALDFEVGISQLQPPLVTWGGQSQLYAGYMLSDVVSQVITSEPGLLFQNPSGQVVFWNRHHWITATASTVSQATFENATGASYFYQAQGFQPGLDDLDLWNDIPTQINPSNGVYAPVYPLHLARNRRSINEYGERSLQGYVTLLYENDADAIALGQWLLWQYQYPIPRVRSMTMDSAINAGGNLVQMLSRQFLDLVTVIYHAQGVATSFNQPAQIESIKHSIVPGVLWTTKWQLANYIFSGVTWFQFNSTSELVASNATSGPQLPF